MSANFANRCHVGKVAKLAISATLVNMLTQASFCLLIHGYARVLDMEFKTNKHHCV